MGIIVKRPIANGAWGAERSPSAYAAQYYQRAQVMARRGSIPEAPDNSILLALGFVMAHEAIDTAIVGTHNPRHMKANLGWLENDLPISVTAVTELQRRFGILDDDWVQLG
jgi:aryl-alcohol dehydrogenase-like predicted oxidoreductase